jgi:hypothetical protein
MVIYDFAQISDTALSLLPPLILLFAAYLVRQQKNNVKNIPFDETEEVWKCVIFGVYHRLLTSHLIIFNRGDKLVRGISKKSEHRAYIKWHVFREHVQLLSGRRVGRYNYPYVILSAYHHF